ncbi:Protein-L-isoaspartate O-methyltransferase [Paramagnetospirillum magnetotacticum MS-1]|uniref:Protein-L-isoaspartate O-methyltransferase n=1 Tax=Paramagnetospirillum magnetotacticum MS-1 TaxID=272627 RepID=A0A0C2YVI4_PARME|nr:protein-L-isoaspartate O-methyltransferase [Paramagnetospirillum magnetotacticum]KIL98715.1 Protein-L-isoaspartate O-methyltransferase [Paramagnetospirillum magnetotacticum MS-1]
MDYAGARYNMVENQIRTNKVHDLNVSGAISSTPREAFLPKAMRAFAYVDEDVSIGGGRFVIEPLVLARLLQAAAIQPSDVVLAIGDATGWACAVLSKLASTVVSLESDADLSSRASQALSDQGVDNVAYVTGSYSTGYTAQAPYDVIIYLGAVGEIPSGLCRQLSDGGRLVAVADPGGKGAGKVVQVIRVGDTFGRRPLFDAATPYLPGMAPRPGFVF